MLWYRVLALKSIPCFVSGLFPTGKNSLSSLSWTKEHSRYFTSQDRQAHLALEVYREMDWEVVAQQH